MRILSHWIIAPGAVLAFYLCPGLLGTTAAASDQAATLADAIAQDFSPAQLATLITGLSGNAEAPSKDTDASLEKLQRDLNVGNGAAVALLRIFDHQEVGADLLIKDLAQSATVYHAIAYDLDGMKLGDPAGQLMIAQARAAVDDGRFGDAEGQLRQIEDREVAAAVQQTDGGDARPTSEHQFAAAQTLTLLGKLALMELQYGTATEDFQMARQQLVAPSGQQPSESEPRGIVAAADTAPAAPPAQPTSAGTSSAASPIVVAMVRPAVVPAVPDAAPRSDFPPPAIEAMANPAPTAHALSADMLEVMLRRGDELFGLGDLVSARLLYQRVAAAGEARGATGMAKTYDPQVLTQIGARSIQPDPDAAATWYRKALSLGDTSAAARLRLLERKVSIQ